jgi:hypothetical protein
MPSAAQQYLRSRGLGSFVGVAPDKASALTAPAHGGTGALRIGRGGGDPGMRTGVASDWGIGYRDIMERRALRDAEPTSLAEMGKALTTRRLDKARAAKQEQRRRRRARSEAAVASTATATLKHSTFSQRPEKGWVCTLNTGTAMAPAFTCLTRNPDGMPRCIACGCARDPAAGGGSGADGAFATSDFIMAWKLRYGGAAAFHVEVAVDAVSDTELEEVEEFHEHARKVAELEHEQHVQHVELLKMRRDLALSEEAEGAAGARAGARSMAAGE